MDIFVKYDSTDIIPGIDEIVVEVKNVPEVDKAQIHVIPSEENDKNDKNVKMDENLTEMGKQSGTRLEREMRKLDTSYNPTTTSTENQPIRDGNAVVTGNANVIPIEIPKDEMADFCEEVHNTAVTSDVGDPKTFQGAMSTGRAKLWKFS